jgi:mono/diheme cytochrome c family protein
MTALAGPGLVAVAAYLVLMGPQSPAEAGWLWGGKGGHALCGHAGCAPDQCVAPAGWGGQWFWVRSPDQEQRVVMSLYNRYCIRCHGVDGRGVWDIPDVPDFTDPRWQGSRPDPQIVNILAEGRGAVMPSFRGTLTLEEMCAMARYLRSFVPGTEVSRPDVGRAAAPRPAPPAPAMTPASPPPPAAPRPAQASR